MIELLGASDFCSYGVTIQMQLNSLQQCFHMILFPSSLQNIFEIQILTLPSLANTCVGVYLGLL